MSLPDRTLVVIGLGSVLRRDDAVGVRVVERLRATAERDPQALPAGTRLVDGGTLGLDLLAHVHEACGLVLVDATRLGGTVGAVSVLHGDAIPAAGRWTDGGDAGAVAELLATARLLGWLPDAVAMIGIEIADLGFGMDLTPAVEAAIPGAAAAVRVELRRMHERPTTGMHGGRATARVAGATA